MRKIAVFATIFSQDSSNILLIERRDVPVWTLPGGGVEEGEEVEKALIREVEEETGFQVIIKRKIGTYLPVNRLSGTAHLFECTIISGDMALSEETKNIQFFPLNNLPKRVPPPFYQWIEDSQKKLDKPLYVKTPNVSYWIMIKLLLSHPILTMRFLLTKIGLVFNSKPSLKDQQTDQTDPLSKNPKPKRPS